MSVSFKIGSEESVTSQYHIPVIDLCFDDKIHVDLVHGNCTLEAQSREEKCMKKIKLIHPNKPSFHAATKRLIGSDVKLKYGSMAKSNEKGKVEVCGPSVIVLDISDESSG